MKVSVVIPVHNERDSVTLLHEAVVRACAESSIDAEILFIDDGSTDGTQKQLASLTPAKVVYLRGNFGQTAALDAGIKESKGDVIVTMDGDGQNDPKDIAALLAMLDEGFDAVSGWRKKRMDPWSKVLVSKAANALRSIFVKDGIHDSGCGIKAYKRSCFDNLDLYGETHRFIPGMLRSQGFSVTEIEVNHLPRKHGTSKYGFARTVKGFLDMVALWFWGRYSARPLHLFGGIGLLLSVTGALIIGSLFVLRLVGAISLEDSVWPLAGFFLVLAGIQLFVSGILGEIAVRSYYRSHSSRPYSIKEITERR